uniref:B30.2/SPRY domain-containing protein n=1 Tax=Neogobius melanostomus TaxID=47308 RepID=A0A8C6TEP5_9GOBI
MFSRSESKLICLQCFSEQHKAHDAVPLKVQREANEAQLKEMIQKRRAKIEEIQSSVQLSQNKADKEIQDGVKVFDALMECVQRSQDTFKETLRKASKHREKAAELIEKIRKEILELMQKAAELEEASHSEDHLLVLQKFGSLTPKVDDWSAVSVQTEYSAMLVQAVDELQNKQFADECRKVFMVTLSRLKRFEAEVTFDPDTAQSCLEVSADKKEVRHTSSKQSFSLFPDRFRSVPYVMGQQKISSGQVYFEVTVRNKIMWAVGVANESARTQLFQSYDTSQMWLMTWDNEENCPAKVDGFSVPVRSTPQNIGVFVDYDRRRISFYDADTADFIDSAENCGFSGDIRAIFSPGESMKGKNGEPLKLCP